MLILASGMLAAQFMTSSVWLSVRYRHLLDAPIQLLGERIADVLIQLDRGESLTHVVDASSYEGFEVRMLDGPDVHGADREPRAVEAESVLHQVVDRRLPVHGGLDLLELRVLDADGGPAGWLAMLGFSPLTVVFVAQMQCPQGNWLHIRMALPQSLQENGWAVLGDLIWRVYLLRILIVIGLVMLAVRWVVEPLSSLARAAQAIERDVIAAPVLAESGPLEVRHAAHAFNRMSQRIAADLEQRTHFLAAVSHDLRSPITRMRLRLELMDSQDDLDAAKGKLRSDLSAMEGLINSTLAYIKAGQLQDVTQMVNVDTLAESLCRDWRELGSDIVVQGTCGTTLGNESSLRRAIENLIENAIRYAGHARITLSGDDEQITVRVWDDGPGIAREQLERIHLPFVRGEQSRNQATGGHGLGLSIVEAVMSVHQGTLTLRNRRAGQGFEAVMQWPRLRSVDACLTRP